MNWSLPQIKISYTFTVPETDRIKVTGAKDVADAMRDIWEDIEYRESFYVVCLNTRSQFLGYFLISIGGLSYTPVYIRSIMQVVLLSNAASFIVLHNHPSGNDKPSSEDKKVTKDIKDAARLMNLVFLDHIIMLPEGFTSFADEGLL